MLVSLGYSHTRLAYLPLVGHEKWPVRFSTNSGPVLANRLNLITHPDSTTETSVYDPDGDLVIWTNRGGFGVVRCYDALNRKVSETGITGASVSGACATGGTTNLTTRSWDIQPRTFGYDLAGRLTGASSPNYPITYAYDAAGRPTVRGGSWYAGYGWDNAGNLQTLTYPDGATAVTYQYDPLNRTTKALIGASSYGALTYDTLGRRQTLTFKDGSTQTWNYDNADRVSSIVHVFPNDAGHNVTFSYGYDPSGRDASKAVDNSAFAYMPTAASTAYATANALNQYPSVSGYAYSYWPEGGLKQTDAFQANYNELGKAALTYITPTPGTVDPNNFDIQGIDALDHVYFHYRQTTAGSTYPFIYHSTDGLRPETIWEWQCQQTPPATPVCTGTGTGTKLYVLGPDPDERWAFVGVNGGIYSPHTDREGTLIAIANGGNASAIYAYDAYGQNASAASDTGTGATGYLYRYTGQRLDPNTSLYDYKAREYSPGLGRFLQPDPAGIDQGPNLYEYGGGDPLDGKDPTGLATANLFPEFGVAGPYYDLQKDAENFNPPGYTTIAGHGNVGFIRDERHVEIPDYGVSHGASNITQLFKDNQIASLKTLMFLSCNAGSSFNNGTAGLAQSAAAGFGQFAIGSTGHIHAESSLFGIDVSFTSTSKGINAGSFEVFSPSGARVQGINIKSITYNQLTKQISYDGKSSVSGTYMKIGSLIPQKVTCDQNGCH